MKLRTPSPALKMKEHLQPETNLQVADVTSSLHATTKLQRQSSAHISHCTRSSQDVPATTDKLVVLQQSQTRQPPKAARQRDERITYEATVIEKVALPSSRCPQWGKICCQWKPSHPLSVSFTIPATRTVGGAYRKVISFSFHCRHTGGDGAEERRGGRGDVWL